MTLDEIGKELLTRATTRLIDEIWHQSIDRVINDQFLSTRDNKFLGVNIFKNVLQYSYDVFGFDDLRFESYFSSLCQKLDEIESKPPADYHQHPLYLRVKKLRGLSNAVAEDLLAPDIGFLAERSAGPSQKETMEFMEALLNPICNMLDLAFNPANQLKIDRSYVNDIINEHFYPTLPNRLPQLIMENLARCPDVPTKEQQLDKMLKIFYPNLAPQKSAELKDTFLKLGQVNDQLTQKGYGQEELTEALKYYEELRQLMKRKSPDAMRQAIANGKKGQEMLVEMRRLMAIPVDPFPQQEPELSIALAKQFNLPIDLTSAVESSQKHLNILRGAYLTATSLSAAEAPKDEVPVIANLLNELSLKSNFLDKVQTQSLDLPISTQK